MLYIHAQYLFFENYNFYDVSLCISFNAFSFEFLFSNINKANFIFLFPLPGKAHPSILKTMSVVLVVSTVSCM